MKQTRVLFADDHAILIDGLISFVGRRFEVAGVAHDGRSLIEKASQTRPDVIVIDVSMPGLNGIDAARILRREDESAKLLFLTMHSELPIVEEALRAGASGYVLKIGGAEELMKAIQCVAAGKTYVTPLLAGDLISTLITTGGQVQERSRTLTLRQREVLQLLAEGKTMKEVGGMLNISTRTTETHKYEIMRQLGVKTTAELIRYAVRVNLV